MVIQNGEVYLTGDGSFGFRVLVDGSDLVVRDARATWFGGDNDPEDSGETASGIRTKGNPLVMGCALPMDTGPCKGAPLPFMPYKKTLVQVFNRATGHVERLPVIDLGPNKPPRAHAQIDLTKAAFAALGGDLRRGELRVDYRVLGGAKYLSDEVRDAIRAGKG